MNSTYKRPQYGTVSIAHPFGISQNFSSPGRRGVSTIPDGDTKKKKDGPTSLITELAKEGYFKSKRTISDIQKKLEERGHIYAITSISPCLTRLTKNRTLRRLKENKVWVYVS